MNPNMLWLLIRDGVDPLVFVVPTAGMARYSLARLVLSLKPRRPIYVFNFAGMDNDLPVHASVEAKQLIGFFINTLALYTDLSGSPSFWELAA